MGRTLPPFRFGLHSEIASWNPYRRALRKGDREIFDEMIDRSNQYWSAASNAPRPFLFESLVMSIIFAHQAKLERMRKDVAELGERAKGARLSERMGKSAPPASMEGVEG